MKPILVSMLLIFSCQLLSAQEHPTKSFFSCKSGGYLYYVKFNPATAYVYQVGYVLDKGGAGYLITKTDTLNGTPEKGYAGSNKQLLFDSIQPYLVIQGKTLKKEALAPVKDSITRYKLNNAWYLQHFFDMSKELEDRYPLNKFEWRIGFYAWKNMPDKDADHLQFRELADKSIQAKRDSVTSVNDRYTLVMNYIITNAKTMDYRSVKDSLGVLPYHVLHPTQYFAGAVRAIARQQPEYFVKMASETIYFRDLVFDVLDRETAKSLRGTPGYDELRKAYNRKDLAWNRPGK